jgi:hypothetical protein
MPLATVDGGPTDFSSTVEAGRARYLPEASFAASSSSLVASRAQGGRSAAIPVSAPARSSDGTFGVRGRL